MRLLMSIMLLGSLAGCGEPLQGMNEDAKAAKAQAREAVSAAEDAAKRVEELSRPAPAQPPAEDP
jgi:predicted small lipoprotein YifL